jgi:5-methylcytosine-specific restriction endonuclease McrA
VARTASLVKTITSPSTGKVETFKYCGKCSHWKLIEEYYLCRGVPTSPCKDCVKQRSSEWHFKNPERHYENVKKWREENPFQNREQSKLHSATRRAQKQNVECNFTSNQWFELLLEANFRCHYCSIYSLYLTQDHKIPLSKNGAHTKENIVPACRSCNCSKGDKDYIEFLDYRKGILYGY